MVLLFVNKVMLQCQACEWLGTQRKDGGKSTRKELEYLPQPPELHEDSSMDGGDGEL